MLLRTTTLRLSATVLALLCLALVVTSANAGAGAPLIYVDDDGDCGTLAPCFDTIQQAVRLAIPPNTDIMVLPGTYNESVDLDEAADDTGGTHGDIAFVSAGEDGNEAAGALVNGGSGSAFGNAVTFQGNVRIDGFMVMSNQSDGIGIVASGDVTVRDVMANGVSNGSASDDTGDDGVDLTSLAGNVLVENSFAHQTRPPGADYADGFDLKAPAGDVTIRGSQASGNKGSFDNDGIDIYDVGGNVLIENSIALDNGEEGFGVEAEGNVVVRTSADGSNGDDGTEIYTPGDVLVEYHGSEANEDDGLDIVAQGSITVRHSRLRNNEDTGMDLSTIAAITIDRVIVEGNNTATEAFAGSFIPFRRGGIEIHEYDVSPSVESLQITNSLVRNNIGDGIYLRGIVDQAPVDITSNAICNNTEAGLSLFSSTIADATANWWGNASGPEHPENPGGTGDEIIYDSGLPIGDVDFEPWIETSRGELLTPPAVAGQPADIGFYFTDQADTVALQGGPGMEGVPAFNVTTDNGAVASDEPGQQPGASTGASVNSGVLAVELTADTEGAANLTATGPCGLAAALQVPVEAGGLHGDVDCNGSVNSVDALKILRYVAGLSVLQTEPCTDIGTAAFAAPGSAPASVFGDVNCNGAVTAVDSLAILRYVAALPPLSTPPDCPEIGT